MEVCQLVRVPGSREVGSPHRQVSESDMVVLLQTLQLPAEA